MNILQAIGAEAWAIQADVLEQIIAIADRMGDPSALETKSAQPLRNTRSVKTRDGVAIVPVIGPIFHRANMFTDISGATSNELLARDISAALDDPTVKALLLNIDSPGGQVAGTSELADIIFAGRDKKPIHAYIEARGASGGYWLASAADHITINNTGMAGSIGVVMAADVRKRNGEIEIVSSNAPNKRVDAGSDEGLRKLQALVDRLETEFTGAVAKHRGVSVETVLTQYGQGGLFVGSDAVDAGLVDGVGSFESALAGLAGATNRSSVHMTQTAAAGTQPATITADVQPVITIDLIKSQYPQIASGLRKEGEETAIKALSEGNAADVKTAEKRGADTERARIQAVHAQGQQLPGHGDLISQLMFDGQTTGPEAAVKILSAERETRANTAAKYHSDAPPAAPTAATDATNSGSKTHIDPNLPVEERCKAAWEANVNGVRSEFTSLQTYTSYTRAKEAGRIKMAPGVHAAA